MTDDLVHFERAYVAVASDPCEQCGTVSVTEVWGPEPADVQPPSVCYECGAKLPPPKPKGFVTVTGIDRGAGTITVGKP